MAGSIPPQGQLPKPLGQFCPGRRCTRDVHRNEAVFGHFSISPFPQCFRLIDLGEGPLCLIHEACLPSRPEQRHPTYSIGCRLYHCQGSRSCYGCINGISTFLVISNPAWAASGLPVATIPFTIYDIPSGWITIGQQIKLKFQIPIPPFAFVTILAAHTLAESAGASNAIVLTAALNGKNIIMKDLRASIVDYIPFRW